jgi:hypothetical protein
MLEYYWDIFMRLFFLFLLILFYSSAAQAQINLLRNGDFLRGTDEWQIHSPACGGV